MKPMPNLSVIDPAATQEFLRIAYEPEDWIAALLKRYDTAEGLQRVGPTGNLQQDRMQRWLRMMNARRFNIYVSVNAITPGLRRRTREAVGHIRHVFLDVDKDGPTVLNRIRATAAVPEPSYVLESSPGRLHLLWRATGFTTSTVERLQRHLAEQYGGDLAATSCTQMTRLPGFLNHKYVPPNRVQVGYADFLDRRAPDDFPAAPHHPHKGAERSMTGGNRADVVARARRYAAAIPPAIAGQHGDLVTFRLCCRLVRGFLLSDQDALSVLRAWNEHCEPPWRDRELIEKIRAARRYGKEPLGGLLGVPAWSQSWKQ